MASATLHTARHQCSRPRCPDSVVLRSPSPTELLVSWVRDDGRDGTFVTLADVMAAHQPDDIAGLAVEHGGCLNEVAATLVGQANDWLRPGTVFEPFDDVALSASIEGLIDFAAELASLVLAKADSGQADSTDWAPAVVVLRAVTSLSSAVAALDAIREALQPPD